MLATAPDQMEVALTDYVAALCHMQGSEVVPSETERITADNDRSHSQIAALSCKIETGDLSPPPADPSSSV